MKIAIICYNHFDATISLGKHLRDAQKDLEIEFIFILSRGKTNVEIINFNNDQVQAGFMNSSTLKRSIDKEILNYLGDNQLKVFLFNSISISDLKNYKLLWQLKKYIKKNAFDVIHFVGNNPFIVLLNSFIRNTSKFYTIHEPYPFIKISGYRLLRHKIKMNLIIRSGASIILPSNISYRRFIDNFKTDLKNITIIPFGLFEIYRSYDNEIHTQPLNLLYFGHVSAYKGIDILVKAMQKVYLVNPSIQLIIAGSGNMYIDESNNKNIKILNKYLSNAEIAALNSETNVVVCPYTSASQSGVLMTAFAFNNPVICTAVGALPEVVINNVTGIVVSPGNSDELSNAILDLFNDLDKVNDLRGNIKKIYSQTENSWFHIAEKTYNLYLHKA